jgi:hypothetical protein
MMDSSLVERSIQKQVMDMCFESIVSEAFIGGLPIEDSELNAGLTQHLAQYATECLKDLGSSDLLKEAMESAQSPAKKAYLHKMYDVCMEAASSVTARILETYKNDDAALRDSVKQVSLTPEEYARFSKAAASLTPSTLTSMIQKKTLDVIKDEKEAYKKDSELQTELVNALAAADEDEEGFSTEDPEDKGGEEAAPQETPDEDVSVGEGEAPEAPNNDDGGAPDGADIGQESYGAAQESHFVDVQNSSKKEHVHTGAWIGRYDCECCGKAKDPKKAQEAFESYMKSLAGERYRSKHCSVFSRIQELAYEGIMATTESYTDIPFETMTLITKQNTFSRFNSHQSKSLCSKMDCIGRYAFESVGTPDTPQQSQDQLSTALLTSSIIYTFFETLNSMNLYCPKLDEVKRFVDETIPISQRVELDRNGLMDAINGMVEQVKASTQRATTVPEVDEIRQDLDVVREKCNAPGFESHKGEIKEKLDGLESFIAQKRDRLIEEQRPVQAAVENYGQTLQRTRDTLKFSRAANVLARKPNVSYIKCKVDPQANSQYVAVECYTVDHRPAGSTTVVLESNFGNDLVGYVMGAIESSALAHLDKKYMVSDKRSGKVYKAL